MQLNYCAIAALLIPVGLCGDYKGLPGQLHSASESCKTKMRCGLGTYAKVTVRYLKENAKKNNEVLILVAFLVSLVKCELGKYLQTPSFSYSWVVECFGGNLHLQVFEAKGF